MLMGVTLMGLSLKLSCHLKIHLYHYNAVKNNKKKENGDEKYQMPKKAKIKRKMKRKKNRIQDKKNQQNENKNAKKWNNKRKKRKTKNSKEQIDEQNGQEKKMIRKTKEDTEVS